MVLGSLGESPPAFRSFIRAFRTLSTSLRPLLTDADSTVNQTHGSCHGGEHPSGGHRKEEINQLRGDGGARRGLGQTPRRVITMLLTVFPVRSFPSPGRVHAGSLYLLLPFTFHTRPTPSPGSCPCVLCICVLLAESVLETPHGSEVLRAISFQ